MLFLTQNPTAPTHQASLSAIQGFSTKDTCEAAWTALNPVFVSNGVNADHQCIEIKKPRRSKAAAGAAPTPPAG
ncbi:MAG: hypothetical protein ACHP84_00175 [Caulobacterales bacterium]